jgi:hypothetical protein
VKTTIGWVSCGIGSAAARGDQELRGLKRPKALV